MTDIINQEIKFLGATVLSFNCQLGLGSSESSLSVELVEDCEAAVPDAFNGVIGNAYYFQAGTFNFGGLLTNWNYSQNGSGRTYSATITDPRQLLQNTIVIVDTYLGNPIKGLNYFNAYAHYESSVLNGNCSNFGSGQTGDKGMPYTKVISALKSIDPTISSPTGTAFTINFDSFPQSVPEYYRVAGPSVTILQLLQDVCDVLGYEFYVSLTSGNVINIGLIDLKSPPSSFNYILDQYNGYATEISYGQELRNDVTKTVLFGEKQHYLTVVTKFNHFFGQDLVNGEYVPVVPFKYDVCGFWINKMVDSLNLTLDKPLGGNGPYTIHELDIRSAMASYQLWLSRVSDPQIEGSFNKAIRDNWPSIVDPLKKNLDNQMFADQARPYADSDHNPNKAKTEQTKPKIDEDLNKVWNFIKNLGDTFYGKQFISPLNQLVCYYNNYESGQIGEKIFTDVPTNAGGWVEYGTSVLGLSDPELSFFREDDGRVGAFALFNNSGYSPESADNIGKDSSSNQSVSQPGN